MRRVRRIELAAVVAGASTLFAAVGLSAKTTAGGRDIASAPTIAPRQSVQGYLGAFSRNFGRTRRGEFFKIPLVAGDRVQIQLQSAGQYAPCAIPLKPGTNDFNIDTQESQVQPIEKFRQVNNSRFLTAFTAGQTGTYIIVVNDLYDACYDQGWQWAYTFTVLAPHGLRLALPRLATLTSGRVLSVRVVDALLRPVNDSSLTVRLRAAAAGRPTVDLGRRPVARGSARFVVRLPVSYRGRSVTLIASAGDNLSWVGARATRRYFYR